MVSVIIRLLVSLFQAFPQIERIIKEVLVIREKAKIADAIERKDQKDKMVDNAIDFGVGNDCEKD